MIPIVGIPWVVRARTTTQLPPPHEAFFRSDPEAAQWLADVVAMTAKTAIAGGVWGVALGAGCFVELGKIACELV